jgi:acetolactate decarboxylase
VLDEDLTTALHVETLRREQLFSDVAPHVLFQASTIAALLEGRYDGDVSFAELAEHGDLGLGTLDALDGEMIAIDGQFYRADANGHVTEIPPGALTPFAAVVDFDPRIELRIDGPLDHAGLLAEIERAVPPDAGACAIRIDGEFELVHARSVPRQQPPYRPLAEVVASQTVFDLEGVSGSMVGFRFPDHGDGVEIGGFHLHVITADRSRGGHVLDSRTGSAEVRLDAYSDLHVELPPGVELADRHLGDDPELLRRIEREG